MPISQLIRDIFQPELSVVNFLKEEVYPWFKEKALVLSGKNPQEDPTVRAWEEKNTIRRLQKETGRTEPLEYNRPMIRSLLERSTTFSQLPEEVKSAVVDKVGTLRDRKGFVEFLRRDPELAKVWQSMPEAERRKFMVQAFGAVGAREAYFTPIEPLTIGAVMRSAPAMVGSTIGGLLGETGKQVYEAQTGEEAPWYLAPVIDFMAGNPSLAGKAVKGAIKKPWELVKKADEVVSQNITGKLKDTDIDRAIRTVADMEGFRHMSREAKDTFLKQAHYPAMGKMAQGDELATQGAKVAGKLEKEAGSEVLIRYLEDPVARDVVKAKAPEIADELDWIVKEIDDRGTELLKRGILKPSQYEKWQGRYLSRLYFNLDDSPVGFSGQAKKMKLESGRVFESIMDLPESIRKELGYIAKPDLLVGHTIAKQNWIITLDDYYRKALELPEVVPEGVRSYLVSNPFKQLGDDFSQLPDVMSPVYAQKHLIPYIEDYLSRKPSEELKNLLEAFKGEVDKKLQLLEAYSTPAGHIRLDKDGYGVLSGLPVNKDVYNIIAGVRKLAFPEELTSNLDRAVGGLLAWFKMAKVPLNLPASHLRNMVSNIFQWGLSGADPFQSPVYFLKAIREMKRRSPAFIEAQGMGLFHNNFASEEILKVLREVRLDSSSQTGLWRSLLKAMETFSKAYGVIDDVWKMARYMYAREVEKLPVEDAILKAQRTHFDYSLTYPIIKAMRDPKLENATDIVAKVGGTLFPTYKQKALALLYDSLIERPVSLAIMLSTPLILKEGIEMAMEEKHGRAYRLAKKAIPEHQKSPYNMVLMDDEGTAYVVDMRRILPWGDWVDVAENFFNFMTEEGRDREEAFREALKALGVGQNPVAEFFSVVSTGKSGFTGKDTGLGEYAFRTFTPQPIVSAYYADKTGRRTPLEAVLGSPVYKYDRQTLAKLYRSKIHSLKMDFERERRRIIEEYRRGNLSREETIQAIREKAQELKENLRDLSLEAE